MRGDSQDHAEKDLEKDAVPETPQSESSGDIEFEAGSANRRLGYSDLLKPVERVTVREWREDAFKRRTASSFSRSTFTTTSYPL